MPVKLRVISLRRAGKPQAAPHDIIVLEAQERHVRRKLLTCRHGDEVLVDFEAPVRLGHGDELVLEDGRFVQVVAAEEELMEVRGRDSLHLLKLAWHIGNRHLEAQIENHRILVRRDHVIAHMLEHQGAAIRNISEVFAPEHGAYHDHGRLHDH